MTFSYLAFLEIIIQRELQLAQFDLGFGALCILIVLHVDL